MKACILADIYGILYLAQKLDVVVGMVKDIFATKPESAAATGANPFPCTTLQNWKPNHLAVYPPRLPSNTVDNIMDKLSAVMSKMTDNYKNFIRPYKPPYKHSITSPR